MIGIHGHAARGARRRPRYLSRATRVIFVGDSQTAGRGTGTGAREMTGARALSYPTKARDALIAAGYAASSESFAEANNTGALLPDYDPRCELNAWTVVDASVPPTGTGICGLLKKSVVAGLSFRFTPSVPVDTFEIWTPRATYGDMNWNLDGGSSTTFSQTGGTTFLKTTVTTSLGTHQIRLQPAADTTVFLNTVVAYNSAAVEFRLINAACRGWSTTDWLYNDQPWRARGGITSLVGAGDIAVISIGTNDFQTTGALNSLATFKANLQTLINDCAAAGIRVGLVMPMPVDPAKEGSFTYAQCVAAHQEIAIANGLPLVRSDLYLGTWTDGNTAGAVSDNLHWKAPASAALAGPVGEMIRYLAGVA